VHPIEHRPAYLPDSIGRRLRDERRVRIVAETFHRHRDAIIGQADDLAEVLTVPGDGFFVSFEGRDVAMPESLARRRRIRDLFVHVAQGRLVHLRGKIAGHRQGRCAGEGNDVFSEGGGAESSQTEQEEGQFHGRGAKIVGVASDPPLKKHFGVRCSINPPRAGYPCA